jgi:hypothetical protein
LIRIHFPMPAAAAALVLGALALAHAPADARPEPASDAIQRDTTLVFQTGDRVRVSAWPMGSSGTEICGALGRGIRGRGKTMYAQSDGGVGMPTIQRFPTVGTTPYCTRLTRTEGDSVLFTFTKLVRDSQNRLGRYTVGGYRMPQASLARRRVTFRWDTEGMDTVPAIVEPEPAGR